MTRSEAIDQHEHVIDGIVLDAWSRNRTPEAQTMFMRHIPEKVRAALGAMYDEGFKAARDEAEKLNGKPGSPKELFGGKKGKGGDGE